MAKNCGEWGRDKARERYQSGGEVPLPPRDPRKIAPDKKGQINIGSGSGYARGGATEGSKKDVAEDKKLARASGMSMKTWEKSAMDKAHDRKRADGGRTEQLSQNMGVTPAGLGRELASNAEASAALRTTPGKWLNLQNNPKARKRGGKT